MNKNLLLIILVIPYIIVELVKIFKKKECPNCKRIREATNLDPGWCMECGNSVIGEIK
jgi:hypothetical protein